MKVNMIQWLAEQHKALKAFHTLCNQNGAILTVSTNFPDRSETLDSITAALIIADVRRALLKRITETEEAIIQEAH